MRLSSIKLAGFKSFVDATKIPFPDSMTCVVGPNGCGKSNVIDAVRWVLGESSAKNLRGDAMTDVIFNGASSRKPVSQASVELNFDNTEGRLPGTLAARNQVAIKRVVTRDGQSLYYLNGSKCRKRDITDIFLGTGLGPRSYAIIEQGMISRLIESKPHELRVFIEEAAGVSKYKERRRETQTRIRSTKENLERLLDVRAELQTQLDKLANQSEQAQQYRTLKAQQRELKAQLAVLKWQTLHQQQLKKSEQLAKLKAEQADLDDAQQNEQSVLSAYQQQVDDANHALTQVQQQQYQCDNQLARVEQQFIHSKQQQQVLNEQLAKSAQDEEQLAIEHAQQSDAVAEKTAQLEQQQTHFAMEQERVDELSDQHEQLQHHYEQLQSGQQQAQSAMAQQQRQSQDAQHQLQRLEDNHQRAKQALQHLLQQKEAHQQQPIVAQLTDAKAQLKNITEQLAKAKSEQINCEKDIEHIEQQLADVTTQLNKQQSQLQQQQATAKAVADFLAQFSQQEQQSVLLQLDVQPGFEALVEAALMQLQNLQVTDDKDKSWLQSTEHTVKKGALSEHIIKGEYPDLLDRIAYDTQGDTSVLADPHWIALIDEQGHLHGRHWALRGASDSAGVLAKRNELQQTRANIEMLELQCQQLQQQLDGLNAQVAPLRSQREQSKQKVHALSSEHASAHTRLELLEQQNEQWQRQSEQIELQCEQTQMQLHSDEEAIEHAQEQLEMAQASLLELTQQYEQAQAQVQQAQQNAKDVSARLREQQQKLHEASLKDQRAHSDIELSRTKLAHIEQELTQLRQQHGEAATQLEEMQEPLIMLNEQIEQLVQQKEQFAEQLVQAQQALADAKAQLSEHNNKYAGAQQQREQLQSQIQQLLMDEQALTLKAQQALEPLAELKVTLKEVLENLPEEAQQSKWQAKLSKIDKALNELGAVNLAAIDEYEQAKVRKQYLDEQLEDLTKALETLESAIAKIDRQTKAQFKETFEQINQDFGELFPKVFGGGSAYLELTSDDLLESGVAIMARPPGKKNSTIHLLSGGEKALTALSLVFSIFRLNPAPFCMLDEVDAPLDDANVGRFCRLVEEMSQTVQFIYISHNKIAMEMATRLTGVTMAEPGVSRMVAVDIEQAMEMAQAS